MHQPKTDTAQLPFPPPFVFLTFLIIGSILSAIIPIDLQIPIGLRLLLGVALLAIGFFIASRAIRVMMHARTPVDPFEPTTAIVSEGPYRFSRNPIYLALSIVYLGLAIALNAVWAIIIWPLVFIAVTYLIIVCEEKYLEAKFGDVYMQYKSKVRRWI